MITEQVIKEIYQNYNRPAKSEEELNLPYFVALLNPFHSLRVEDGEVVVEGLDEFSPFKRFLTRGLYAVLEFDRNVAFVFKSHILFFSKTDKNLSVHFRPARERSFLARLFGRGD